MTNADYLRAPILLRGRIDVTRCRGRLRRPCQRVTTLSIPECFQTAKDRNTRTAVVSLSMSMDHQQWRWQGKARQGNNVS